MLTVCPALERALDLTTKGPLILLTGYQRPAEIRRLGVTRLEAWLRARKVLKAAALAERAVQAAMSQTTTLPGEEPAAQLIAQLAEGMMTSTSRSRTSSSSSRTGFANTNWPR
jgi:hypothetical protein